MTPLEQFLAAHPGPITAEVMPAIVAHYVECSKLDAFTRVGFGGGRRSQMRVLFPRPFDALVQPYTIKWLIPLAEGYARIVGGPRSPGKGPHVNKYGFVEAGVTPFERRLRHALRGAHDGLLKLVTLRMLQPTHGAEAIESVLTLFTLADTPLLGERPPRDPVETALTFAQLCAEITTNAGLAFDPNAFEPRQASQAPR